MRNFNIEIDADGIAVVRFDIPGRSMNVITAETQADLVVLAARIAEDPAITGAVLVSGKSSGFCAGADLGEMEHDIAQWRAADTQAELSAGVATAGRYSRALRLLETCGKPLAAAVGGLALGGGLELALACPIRVGIDDPKLRLAFPEATIGLMPGAGGTQRLPRLMGIARALPYLLEGTLIPPAVAVETRILHEIVPASSLVEAAKARVRGSIDPAASWDRKGFTLVGGLPHSDAGYRAVPFAIAAVAGTSGSNHPAKANILRAVYEGVQVPIDAGLRIESRYFFNTVRSAQAASMIATSFTTRQNAAKAGTSLDNPVYAKRLRDAWDGEAAMLVDEGLPATLVRQVAGHAGGWAPLVDERGQRSPHHDLPDPVTLTRIRDRLFLAVESAAKAAIDDGVVAGSGIANLLAVQAGFPVWTGGPIRGG